VIGLISDTHSLMRPQALAALQGVELIIHAGDIGGPEVLHDLRRIAPVIAIKGNNDRGHWAKSLPNTKLVRVNGTKLYIIHNVKELDCDPTTSGIQVVISGHSHKPTIASRGGVLYVNPGSAGPRRFKLPIAVAKLRIKHSVVESQIIELKI
jgi:uncharacterized protein